MNPGAFVRGDREGGSVRKSCPTTGEDASSETNGYSVSAWEHTTSDELTGWSPAYSLCFLGGPVRGRC